VGHITTVLTQWALAVMALCNNATVKTDEYGSRTGLGDQTEVALAITAASSGFEWATHCLKRVHEFAFDSDRKRMTVACKVVSADTNIDNVQLPQVGSIILLSKGAPEVLLELCSYIMLHDGRIVKMELTNLQEIDHFCEAFSAQGLRTLALAVRLDNTTLPDDVSVVGEMVRYSRLSKPLSINVILDRKQKYHLCLSAL
jgi:Ca2+-transporting ATPase